MNVSFRFTIKLNEGYVSSLFLFFLSFTAEKEGKILQEGSKLESYSQFSCPTTKLRLGSLVQNQFTP